MILRLAFLILIVWSAGLSLGTAFEVKMRPKKRARVPAAAPKTVKSKPAKAPKPVAKPAAKPAPKVAIPKGRLVPRPRLAEQLQAAVKDDALFKRSIQLVQKKKYGPAKKFLFSLTKRYPQNGLYWFNLGNVYYLTKEYENAIKCYRNVMFAKSPLAPAAEVYLAKTYLATESIRDALPILANLETLALPSGLKMELESTREEFLEKVRLQAVGFYQARRNDETIEVLLWANKQYPRSEHLVLVGMTWLRMGKPKRARTAFRIARDLAKEQSMTDEVDNFLRQIREGTWDADRVFFPYVDLSAGYNTNVFSEFVDPQAKVGYKVATGGVLHLHRGEANFANLRYRLLWEEYDGLVDDQFLTYSVSVQFIHDKDNWLYEITPRFQHQFVNLASNLYKPGAFLRLQRRIDSSEYGLSVDYAVGKSTQDEVAYLAGPTSSVTLFWNSYWPELQATFFVFGEREDIGVYESTPGDTTPLAFDGFGPGLRLIWYPTDAWEFSGGVTYSKRTYKPTALPEDVIRSDAQTSLWTRAGYRLDKDLSLYISGDFTGNRSTLDSTNLKNKNYNQGSVFGGVTWELSL